MRRIRSENQGGDVRVLVDPSKASREVGASVSKRIAIGVVPVQLRRENLVNSPVSLTVFLTPHFLFWRTVAAYKLLNRGF